jgi:hypothetical protein
MYGYCVCKKIYTVQKYLPPPPHRIWFRKGNLDCSLLMCQGSQRIWELFLCTVISRFGFYSLFILCSFCNVSCVSCGRRPRLKLQWYNYFLQFVCFSASNYSWIWRCQRTLTVVTINHMLYHALRDRFGSFWFTISGLKRFSAVYTVQYTVTGLVPVLDGSAFWPAISDWSSLKPIHRLWLVITMAGFLWTGQHSDLLSLTGSSLESSISLGLPALSILTS